MSNKTDFELMKKNFPVHFDGLAEFLELLKREGQKGKVLIASAYLEERLADCLVSRLVIHPDVKNLVYGSNAPLGTFFSRIVGCLATGIISNSEYEELQVIRKIRNKFAHDLKANFGLQSIVDHCKKLAVADPKEGEPILDVEGQFTAAVIWMVLKLTNRPHCVSEKRIEYEKWRY